MAAEARKWGLVYHPGRRPYAGEVRDFAHIQELCGGYIERVVLDWGARGSNRYIQLWCNEDGIGMGLELNVWAEGPSYEGSPIFGPCVVLAARRLPDGDEEDLGLTDEEIQLWANLKRPVRPQPTEPKNLEQLLERIRAGAYSDQQMTSLPTFGGLEPSDTEAVWSWDESRLLVGYGRDDLRIIDRAVVS